MTRNRLTVTISIIAGFLFTILLIFGHLGQVSYVTLLSITAIVALAVAAFDRIREIDLKNLKLSLEDHRSRIEEIEFDQHIADAQLKMIKSKSIRFEDIRAEKAVEEHLPELQTMADEYMHFDDHSWTVRVRRKNEIAVTMALHVLSFGIPKHLLADQEHEGLIMALAASVYAQPEYEDFALLQKCYRKVHRLHIRWRIVACIEKMLWENLIKSNMKASIIEILDFFEDGADRSLSLKIQRTREILNEN